MDSYEYLFVVHRAGTAPSVSDRYFVRSTTARTAVGTCTRLVLSVGFLACNEVSGKWRCRRRRRCEGGEGNIKKVACGGGGGASVR